uniref:Secreted protein n=1 Tax=Arundo donax TaxID=35708 RepID=A0A0A9EWV7_ARUDO
MLLFLKAMLLSVAPPKLPVHSWADAHPTGNCVLLQTAVSCWISHLPTGIDFVYCRHSSCPWIALFLGRYLDSGYHSFEHLYNEFQCFEQKTCQRYQAAHPKPSQHHTHTDQARL